MTALADVISSQVLLLDLNILQFDHAAKGVRQSSAVCLPSDLSGVIAYTSKLSNHGAGSQASSSDAEFEEQLCSNRWCGGFCDMSCHARHILKFSWLCA